ncbi:MAG: DUF721 domain-containing protein [Hydrogenophaga sp.]|nr:DUF721 domain-containing protein [Hydrogenophaga sp.]
MSIASGSKNVFSLEQAVCAEPSLSALQTRIRESIECLDAIQSLIPIPLRNHLQAGPLNDGEWCLLVRSPAAATKMRQLLPAISQRLTEAGYQINSVRLRVQATDAPSRGAS